MRTTRGLILCLVIAALLAATSAYAADENVQTPANVQTPTRVYIKDTEPHKVAMMLHQGPYTDLSKVIASLMGEIDKGGFSIAGPVMAMFISNPETTPQKDLKWQVIIPVAYPGVMGQIQNDKMGFQLMDPMHVAFIYHIGPYEKIGETYKVLFDWAKTNNYKILGFPTETYWSDPVKTPKEKQVTEIWIPIEERKNQAVVR